MGDRNAWVTLATNDSYCLGALVLAHSLRRASTAHPVVILITPGVSPIMRERLSHVFAEVINVDVLDSGDAAHLALLARPELGITFTKLHCWTLTQYTKCVFLDADTLVLQNCDELFEKEELSAAPDVGWPDCFNSGVFVYRPSNETFTSLVEFAKNNGSFDGGDQGLLNQYFSSWASGDISKHLSFLYNVCSTSFYSYLPALKQFGHNMKIVHFIGQVKPWLESFNWTSRSVNESGSLQGPLQQWWNIFIEHVHPALDITMPSCNGSGLPTSSDAGTGHMLEDRSPARYIPPNPPRFPWHHPESQPQEHDNNEQRCESFQNDFVDPWEVYAPPPQTNEYIQPEYHHQEKYNDYVNDNIEAQTNEYIQPEYHRQEKYNDYVNDNIEAQRNECHYEEVTNNCNNHHVENHMDEETIRNLYTTKAWYECFTNDTDEQNQSQVVSVDNNSMSQDDMSSTCGPGGLHCGTEYMDVYSQQDDSSICDGGDCLHNHDNITTIEDDIRPRHPYDNFYLLHQVVLSSAGHRRCAHEVPPEAPPVVPQTPSPPPSPTPEEYEQTGVAGALSQMTLGQDEASSAMEEHLRRQGWEAGNMDYMGADAFDNIWAKISQTLSLAPASSGPEPEPTPESAPESIPTPTVDTEISLPDSRASTESFEQVSGSVTPIVSDISISKPSSLETSTDSSFTTVSSAPPSEAKEKDRKESTALTEEEADHTQASMETSQQQQVPPASPTKPKEKLVCHLKPVVESDALLTPESELEDAATIAHKIIASEEALSSPIVTSATPMTSPPICPIVPQNVKDLIVENVIPGTPPLSGPVSLAQIGIVPSKQVSEEQKSILEIAETPQTLVQLTESKVREDSKPKAEIIELSMPVETATPTSAECIMSKTPEPAVAAAQALVEDSIKQAEVLISFKESPQIEETKPSENLLKKIPDAVKESESLKEAPEVSYLSKCSLPAADEKSTEVTKTPVKKVKKVVKQKSSSETPPKTPDAEGESKKLVCSLKTKGDPPNTVAEITLPTDLQNVALPKVLEKAILDTSSGKSEKKVDPVVDITPKKDEEEAAKPKVKKVVKKVPATPKTDALGSEGGKKAAEGPVPPPRKKVVKPKDK